VTPSCYRSDGLSAVSAEEILDEALAFLVGGGLITMVLFPLALPIILLVIVPAIAIGLVAAAAGAIVAASLLLLRRILLSGPRVRPVGRSARASTAPRPRAPGYR
jgi:hypothetical protein